MMTTAEQQSLKITLLVSFVSVVLSGNVRRQPNEFGRPSFRSLLEIKDEGTAVEDDAECLVGGNFCQNGGSCSKLNPDDVRGLSSSNEMIYRLQLAALSSTETERQRILGFRCTCTSGFKGEFCQTRALDLASMVPPVWVICVIVAIVICLVALIVAILFYRSRSKPKTDGVGTSTGDLEKADEQNEEDEDETETSEDEAQSPDRSASDMATPQLDQHSQLGRSVIMSEKTAKTSSPFYPEEALLDADGVSRQVDSGSTLISDKPVSEKSYTLDAPMVPDEVWENDPTFKEPFFTESVLLTSNRTSARASEYDDEDNANPLGIGRAYSFVDDSYTNGSGSPMRDTAAQDTYQGHLYRDENDANFSEPNSKVSVNVQSLEIVDQGEGYEEYYNRASPQSSDLSEESDSYRKVRQTQSLDHHQQQSHDNFQPMAERSEFHGSTHHSPERSESFYLHQRAENTPSSFGVHGDSDSYQVIYSAETANDPQVHSDLYRDKSPENPNKQRNLYSREIDEIENRQRNHQVKSVQYSESTRFYKDAPEKAENDEFLQHRALSTILESGYSDVDIRATNSDENPMLSEEAERDQLLQQHRALSTILESGYSDEYIRATDSDEKPMLFNDSAEQLAEMEGGNEHVENEQLYEAEQLTVEDAENVQSNENVDQIQQTETFRTHPTLQRRKSTWPACHDTAHLNDSTQDKSSSRDRLDALIRLEFKRQFKPRKSMSYSSDSNQTKLNRSSNSNSFREQLELLQKGWSPVAPAAESDQLVSDSIETLPSLIDINVSSSSGNQNRSNQNVSGNSLAEAGNGDRDHPAGNVDRDHPSSDDVKPAEVKGVLPLVAPQAKKGEKDKRSKGNRNKRTSRSNPWRLLSGKPIMEDKKKKAGSSRNALNLYIEKPQQKQNPNDSMHNAMHEINNRHGRVVDNDEKTVQQETLPVTTYEDESACSEMTKNENEFLFTGHEDENELQSLQQRLEDACCDQLLQSGPVDEKLLQTALLEQQMRLEQDQNDQNDHQLIDEIDHDKLLDQTPHKSELPLRRLNDEGGQLERAQVEQPLKERAQEEHQLKTKAQEELQLKGRTQEEQQLKGRTQEEQPLLSKSLQMLDKRREKQKSVANERLERLRIEKAHREHQLREKERKEQLRIKNSKKQLQPKEASSKEQQSWFERTSQEELQLENKKQEHRRFENAKKECRPGFKDTQEVHKGLRNAKDELKSSKNIRHEKGQQQEQKKLLEKAAEEVLRIENADVVQVDSHNSPEQRHRFKPLVDIRRKVSEITQQSPEQIVSEEKLPERAKEEKLWFNDERKEKPRLRKSLSERLMVDTSQTKLTSLENNGQRKQWQFDHFQKEASRLKNGQRKCLQLDPFQAEAPSNQKEHRQFDILQQKDLWLTTEQKEHSLFDNHLQKRDHSPQNGQREHLRFENVRKKFPWPENHKQNEYLQCDSLQKRDLVLKSEQQQEQRLRFENLQKILICPTNDQRDQIQFDTFNREGVDTSHREGVDTFHREGVDTSHREGVDTSQREGVDTSHQEGATLENAQTDEQRSKMTLMRLISESLTRSGGEEIEENRRRWQESHGQGQKRFLWTSRSSLSIRLPRDSFSSTSCSQRRSYSDVALALKDSLENVNNACSSVFKHGGDRFNLVDNDDDEEEESSEWDTLTERTADEESDTEEPLAPSSSYSYSTSSSGKVSLKDIACVPPVMSLPAAREVYDETEIRLNERPVSTAKKVWRSSKGGELLCSNNLPAAVIAELKLHLTHFRQRVAASSDEV